MKKNNYIDILVGKQLRKARIERGISQVVVAEELEITFQQVQKYEAGRNRISASKLYQISILFNVGVEYFFAGVEQKDDTEESRKKWIKESHLEKNLISIFEGIKDRSIRKQIVKFVKALSAEKLDT